MDFNNDLEKISYALGMNVGEYVRNMPLELNREQVIKGIQDVFADNPGLTLEEYQAAMQLCQTQMQSAAAAKTAAIAAQMAEEGEKFLAENAKREGVQTTSSGLQYQILRNGSGKKPSATDKVKVHYTGKLLSGDVFDSSVARGEPASFGLNQVIRGWTEGLQLMPIGAQYRFFIPAKLAYGESGSPGAIPPNATLIFDVELLDIL